MAFLKTKYTTINRRGFDITLPKAVHDSILAEGYNIQLVLNTKKNPSCVQLVENNRYICTLKSYMGVDGFKDSNPCNFRKSNLIAE